MHQRDQETCAHQRRVVKDLIDIADQVHESRNLVDAAFMAAHHLHEHEQGPMAALLYCVSLKLRSAAEALEAKGQAEGSTDAA